MLVLFQGQQKLLIDQQNFLECKNFIQPIGGGLEDLRESFTGGFDEVHIFTIHSDEVQIFI
jgi:hypothetical protein